MVYVLEQLEPTSTVAALPETAAAAGVAVAAASPPPAVPSVVHREDLVSTRQQDDLELEKKELPTHPLLLAPPPACAAMSSPSAALTSAITLDSSDDSSDSGSHPPPPAARTPRIPRSRGRLAAAASKGASVSSADTFAALMSPSRGTALSEVLIHARSAAIDLSRKDLSNLLSAVSLNDEVSASSLRITLLCQLLISCSSL